MRSILLSGFVALRYKGAFQQDRTASAFLCQKLLTGTSSVKAGLRCPTVQRRPPELHSSLISFL